MLLLPPADLVDLKLVGSGGFGNVYRGWSKMLAMDVALKVIQGAHSSNLKKLMKERDVMQKASNPYVLRLLGIYEKVEGNLSEHGLVMEYMPYGSLCSLFDNISNVPWALRFRFLHQVVLGMNYLHSLDPPIIHRDLKPSNVLLNDHLVVQITDFGLSKISGATTSTMPSFAGTLSYMPPEAIMDINYQLSKSYDVYSFGILVWTIFSGEEPYPGVPAAIIQCCVCKGQRPRETVLDQYSDIRMVPEAKDLMVRCWAHNADNRPSFHECSELTTVMHEVYKSEIVNDVRNVQDRLTNMHSAEQEMKSISLITGDTDAFVNALQNEHQDSCLGAAGGEPKPSMASETIIETKENEDNSTTGDSMDNIVTTLKNSGDYKKIIGKLNNEGLISEDDQQMLNSSQNLKDFGRAAEKAILGKIKDNPALLLPKFKSLFEW